MLKLAIFDLGNVLYLNHFERALEVWAAATGRDAEAFQGFLALEAVHEPFERGALAPEEFHDAFNRVCGVEIPFDAFAAGWNAIYGDYIPGTREAIVYLKGRMPVVALTNTNELHCPTWQGRYADALALFDAVYISNELGMRKPDPEIFTYVLDRHAVAPQEAIFFDDNPANVAAARQMGILAHHVIGPETIPQVMASIFT